MSCVHCGIQEATIATLRATLATEQQARAALTHLERAYDQLAARLLETETALSLMEAERDEARCALAESRGEVEKAEQLLERHWVCPCCRRGCTDPDCCTAAETNGAAALAAAEQRGRDRERAEIVAWLRSEDPPRHWAVSIGGTEYTTSGDAIESGAHHHTEIDHG